MNVADIFQIIFNPIHLLVIKARWVVYEIVAKNAHMFVELGRANT